MHSNRLGWLLLAPTMIILFFFGVVPFFYVIWVSFHQWNPFAANPNMVFNWASNYRQVVFDAQLLASLGVTFAFVESIHISTSQFAVMIFDCGPTHYWSQTTLTVRQFF